MASSKRIYIQTEHRPVSGPLYSSAEAREPARAKMIEFLGPPSLVTVAHLMGQRFSVLVDSIEARTRT